jgi:hypothetical protein
MFLLDLNEEVFFIHNNSIKKGNIIARFYRDSIDCEGSISYSIKTKGDNFIEFDQYIYTDIEQAAKQL